MNQDILNFNKIFKATECLTKEQLLDYVNQQLTGSALRQVELHICDCPFCSDAVDGLAAEGTAGFEASLDRIRPDFSANAEEEAGKIIEFPSQKAIEASAPAPAKRRNFTAIFSIAAAVAVLLTFAFIFLGGSMTPNQIADEYFTLGELEGLRGGEPNNDSLYNSGKRKMEDAIKSEDKALYQVAADDFRQVSTDEAAFRGGQCFYKAGKFADAEAEFKRAIAIDKTHYKDMAEFNLAITYLKLNRLDEAKSGLEKISQQKSHPEYAHAKDALKDLNRAMQK